MITGILAGIAAKLAGMGVAAKAAAGLGIATVATAGVASVLPVVVPDAPGTTPAVEVQLPTVPTDNADRGLGIAADATSGQQIEEAPTGLERAGQTPTSDHLPEPVPGPPAATGIERARETSAADHLPPFVPGPPASVPPTTGRPSDLPPAAGAGATGIDTATGTPGGQQIPPFVKGMFGRS